MKFKDFIKMQDVYITKKDESVYTGKELKTGYSDSDKQQGVDNIKDKEDQYDVECRKSMEDEEKEKQKDLDAPTCVHCGGKKTTGKACKATYVCRLNA